MERYQIRSGYVLRTVAGEHLAIPVSIRPGVRREMILLNQVGSYLWKQLETERTVEELTRLVTEEYEISGKIAGKDIREFILSLSREGLIQKKNAVSNSDNSDKKRPDKIDY